MKRGKPYVRRASLRGVKLDNGLANKGPVKLNVARRNCQNCKYWQNDGAPAPDQEVANKGICTMLSVSQQTPWFTQGMYFTTLGWQGQACNAFVVGPAAVYEEVDALSAHGTARVAT